MEFPCPSQQYHQYHQYLSAQELRMRSKSSLGACCPRAHPHSNPSRRSRGLKSNKIPLSSCSEDTVRTSSPQKARCCNLLRGAPRSREARAGERQQPHRRCPWERLENVEPATRGISAPTEGSGSTAPRRQPQVYTLHLTPLPCPTDVALHFGWSPRRYSCLNTCAFSTQQTARTRQQGYNVWILGLEWEKQERCFFGKSP